MTTQEEIELIRARLDQAADEKEQAILLLDLLRKSNILNRTDSAPYIRKLMALSDSLNEPDYMAWALHYQANIEILMGQFDKALDTGRQALDIFEQTGLKQGIGSCHHNMGNNYLSQGRYTEALPHYLAGLKLYEELGHKHGIISLYINIGNIYQMQGSYSDSLKNYIAALGMSEDLGDINITAHAHFSIGLINYYLGDMDSAQKNYLRALEIWQQHGGSLREMSTAYNNIGSVCHEQGNYPKAMEYHQMALEMRLASGDKRGLAITYNNIARIYKAQGDYHQALKWNMESLQISEELGEKSIIGSSYQYIADIYYLLGDYPASLDKQLYALQIATGTGLKDLVKDSRLSLSRIYEAMGDHAAALSYYRQYHETEKDLLGEASQKQLNDLHFMHNMRQKEKDLEIEQLRNVELKRERDRSENLLLNILPAEVADELKEKGGASAKLFDNVTVLFTDFVSFTRMSERLTPQQLVDELHACFSAFDEIMTRHGIEKIKTVGDAYLAISGLPLANEDHARNMVLAARELRDYMLLRKKELGDMTFDIRIGMHSGSVVAGIVGVKKFAYDIWGDTVNTAARMEQNSDAGRINISQSTYELVKDHFHCEYRGEIEAKYKGKLKMYFVE